MHSQLYEGLSDEGKKRYGAKLDFVGPDVVDPYTLECSTYVDDKKRSSILICTTIMVNAPSSVTKEELKAYKSLQGYQYFVAAGWVGAVVGFNATTDGRKQFVKARVRHSQSVSAALLQPWVAAETNGTIICAHCTCMAGLGEACSHIAALLFAQESRSKFEKDVACTSVPCQWLAPSLRSVEYSKISDIDFYFTEC